MDDSKQILKHISDWVDFRLYYHNDDRTKITHLEGNIFKVTKTYFSDNDTFTKIVRCVYINNDKLYTSSISIEYDELSEVVGASYMSVRHYDKSRTIYNIRMLNITKEYSRKIKFQKI